MPNAADIARDEWLAEQDRWIGAEQELRIFERSLAGQDVLSSEHLDRSASLRRTRDVARERCDGATVGLRCGVLDCEPIGSRQPVARYQRERSRCSMTTIDASQPVTATGETQPLIEDRGCAFADCRAS